MPYRRLPPLMALRAFEAVARHNSIRKAADELSVTAAAISQQVKKLESDLDLTLIKREPRGIALTKEGMHLKAGLTEAFIQIRKTVDDIRPAADKTEVNFASAPPFVSKWLIPRLAGFLSSHEVEIRISTSYKMQDYVTDNIDLGVRLGATEDDELETHWLAEEFVVPIMSPEFRDEQKIREPRDLLRVPLIEDDPTSWNTKAPSWADWFEAVGLPREDAGRSINFGLQQDQAINAAVEGNGVALGYSLLVSDDIEAGRLVCPFGPILSTHMRWHTVTPKHARQYPQVCVLNNWLNEEMQHCFDIVDSMLG